MKKGKIKDSEFAKMEKVYTNSQKHVDKNFHFYFSYTLRIIFMFIVIFTLGIITYLSFAKSFSNGKDIILNYKEKDAISYDVKLLNNNLFEDGTLTPSNNYISDVIDDISTNLKYEYHLDKNVNIKYTYYVDAIMVINNMFSTEISRNTYHLVEKVIKEEKNIKDIFINQNINLDYDYYNNLANEINRNYDINITGDLLLKMYIDIETSYNGFNDAVKKSNVVEVKIPLLSSQVEVTKVSAINKSDSYVKHMKPELINDVLLYIGIILLIIDTTLFLLALNFIFNSSVKKNSYCKIRDSLLKEYGHIIVNSKNIPNLINYNIINCTKFNELLDAQSLLNKPIIFYETIKNQKSLFIILGTTEAYKFTLKECDIEYYK